MCMLDLNYFFLYDFMGAVKVFVLWIIVPAIIFFCYGGLGTL